VSLAASISTALAEMLAPLQVALEDADQLSALLRELGWTVEAVADDVEAVAVILPVVEEIASLATVALAYEAGSAEAGELVAEGVRVGEAVFASIAALRTLSAGGIAAMTAPLDDPATWVELALDLPEYLFLRWLRVHHPVAFAILVLGGVVAEQARVAGEDPAAPARFAMTWTTLEGLLTDPPATLAGVYGWGGDFDHARLLAAIGGLARAMETGARREPLRAAIASSYFGGAAPADVLQLTVPLHRGWDAAGDALLLLGLVAAPVPASGTGEPDGLLVTDELAGSASASIDLGDGWSLAVGGSLDASGALGITFHPSGVKLATGGAAVGVSLALTGAPTTPWTLLGDADGTRLELAGLELAIAVEGTSTAPELILRADATDALALIVDPGEADAFLADVLGGEPLELRGGFSLRWSSVDGFTLAGGASLTVTIPVDLTAGPIHLDWFKVTLGAGSDGLSAAVAVTGSLELGPFTIVVEDLGVAAGLVPVAPEEGPGDFGSTNATVSLAGPSGLGIEIDTTFASGGGFLAWHTDSGVYSGVFDVDVLGVGISVVGLLATRIDGAEGQWSWYLALMAKLTGLQLGFGFTLEGVGGLIGVNRGLDVDALGDGLRDGALDAILFPADPIADAPVILQQIGTIFPIAIGQYVFGPMVKIGWGTPSLIDVDLGVVFQLPDPLTITLLGSLSSVLPDVDLALLSLHLDVAGTINLSEGTLAIDASLRDSQLLGVSLTGDVAVRASFLDQPSFCLAFGGFHPAFEPPSGFPTLRRLGYSIESGDDFRLGLGCYVAVTSNTVQLGAEATLWARAAGFTFEGGLGFDALLELSPFGFEVGMGAYCTVTAAGIELLGVHLKGTLTGPTPWHLAGTASFKVLGVSTDVKVEATIGAARPAARSTVDVAALVRDALADDGAWLEVLPDGAAGAVIVNDGGAGAVHPGGGVEVRQRLAPTDLALERYGSATVSGTRTITITSPTIGGAAAEPSADIVDDWFATAQYLELADAERLSAPSFERMTCGVRFGGDGVDAPEARSIAIGYEQLIRDPELSVDRPLADVHRVSEASLAASLAAATAVRARSTRGMTVSTRSRPATFALVEPSWAVAPTTAGGLDATLTARAANGTWAAAREVARDNPGMTVVARYEREAGA
jgi:hypothetical protein